MLMIFFNQLREERQLDVSMLSSQLPEVTNSQARIEPAVYTRLFLDLLMEEGFAPREVLVNTGLTAGYLAEPGNLISLEQQIQIYSNIARLTDSPRITLSHGTKIKPHHHGAWGYAVQSAQTIGQALKTFNKFFNVIGPVANLALIKEQNLVRWVTVNIIADGSARRVAIEEMLSGNHSLMKQISGDSFKLAELWLDYDPPKGHESYEEVFGCPVYFGMGSIEMRFDRNLLGARLIHADRGTEEECLEWCRQRITLIDSETGVSGAVRRLLHEDIGGEAKLDLLASQMNMTPRTLRRHLSREGTSFSLIHEDVRSTLAIRYIQNAKISIDEISHLVGYSDPSNFRHAFKKWTGLPPAQFRKRYFSQSS